MSEPRNDFEDRFKRWAERPPATSAEEAGRRILERLDIGPAQKGASGLRRWWMGAAAALLLAAGLFLHSGKPAPEIGIESNAGIPIHPVGEGMLLIWLDDRTPLYMSLTPPSPPQRQARREKGSTI